MSDTRRWSELIPPRTALTFAAMWDPVEGIITFSGGKLLESDLLDQFDQLDSRFQLGDSPRDAYDSQSQVLTIDRLALALASTAPNSALLALEQSRGPVTFRCEALHDAESAVDPYFQTSWGRPTPIDTLRTADSDDSHTLETPKADHWPHLKHLGRQLLSAAKTPFDNKIFHKASCSHTSSTSSDSDSSDEFFEEAVMTANRSSFYSAPMLVNLNLKSAFSVTTTSTTNYIDVDPPSICPSGHHHFDDGCSQLPCSPCTPPIIPERRSERMSDYEDVSGSSGFYASPSPTSETRRLLKKPRREPSSSSSNDVPASPAEVLAREEYNHIYPQSPPGLRKQKSFAKAKVLLDKLTKCKWGADERWVCVEVTHKVTQHVLCQ